MASQKQIDANRRNAKKSTGPNTEDGKNKSRLNAIRDGLTGQITTLSDRDRPAFEKLQTEMLAHFKPFDPMEARLANAIVWDSWRLDHLRAIESNMYTDAAEQSAGEYADDPDLNTAISDARTFLAEAPRLDTMSLYEQRMTRNIHRNLALLRNLQAERKRKYEEDKNEEVLIARFHEFNYMPIAVTTKPSKNGFIFSTEEIAREAVRQRHVDTAKCGIKTINPQNLYGAGLYGLGDEYLQRSRQPLTDAQLEETPEALTQRRLSHPEEFRVRPVGPPKAA